MEKEVSGGQATFEIAELIRDNCSHTEAFNTGAVWVETKMSDRALTTDIETYLGSEGYSLYSEGLQHNGQTGITDFVALPVDLSGDYNVLTSKGRSSYFQVFTQPQDMLGWTYKTTNFLGVQTGATALALTSESSAQFLTFPIGNTIASYQFSLKNGAILAEVFAKEATCNQWNSGGLSFTPQYSSNKDDQPVVVHYVNKHGAKNSFPFTLKHMETIEVSSDGFNRNVADISGLNNQNGKHAFRKRVTGSKQMFTANSDWLDQYFVKQLEELVMSEYVWATIPNFSTNAIPVNIKTKKLEKKNHLNDKLIQYSISFESASEYINTVR
tara:strand:- start:3088 stop:4068 length:981 start_codon:yes stop_codon:yes gene_type:complete